VPPSLADTIAAAACDESVALLLPQLRAAARRVLLPAMRPGALQALQAAAAVPEAWAAGDAVRRELQALLQQLLATGQQQQLLREVMGAFSAAWLPRLREALAGLGYAAKADARLLQCALQGLSLIAAAAAAAADGDSAMAEQAAAVLLSLLQHAQPSVQQLALQLLQSAVDAAEESLCGSDSESDSADWLRPPAVLQLLQQPQVVRWLVMRGLAPSTHQGRRQVATKVALLLAVLLRCGGPSAAAVLLPWRAWVCCFAAPGAGSSVAGAASGSSCDALLAAMDAAGAALDEERQQGQADGGGEREGGALGRFWSSRVAAVLQDLFSASTAVRSAAGRQLLALLVHAQAQQGGLPGLAGVLDEYAGERCVEWVGCVLSWQRTHQRQHAWAGPRHGRGWLAVPLRHLPLCLPRPAVAVVARAHTRTHARTHARTHTHTHTHTHAHTHARAPPVHRRPLQGPA
jgi:hypothetical protein